MTASSTELFVIGGKTGYLEEAGYNLAVEVQSLASSDASMKKPPPLLVVVLGSPTKEGSFASAKQLAQDVWKNTTC